MPTGECRIEPQCFAKILFCFRILLLKIINRTELIVVVGILRLNCNIFQKFSLGVIQFLLLQISPAEIEMNEGKPGIVLSREIKLVDNIVLSFVLDVRSANDLVHFWVDLCDFLHPSDRSLPEL